MYIFLALVAVIAYVLCGRVTFKALNCHYMTPGHDRAVFGITGMIIAALVVGSCLEHLLP